jgi:hypothetical protein
VFFENLGNDAGHIEVLEDALVEAVREVRQLRAQGHRIAAQALAGVALGHAMKLAVNAAAVRCQLQKRGLVQQCLEVERRVFADQFNVEREGLADGFASREGKDLSSYFSPLRMRRKWVWLAGANILFPSVMQRKTTSASRTGRCPAGVSQA